MEIITKWLYWSKDNKVTWNEILFLSKQSQYNNGEESTTINTVSKVYIVGSR